MPFYCDHCKGEISRTLKIKAEKEFAAAIAALRYLKFADLIERRASGGRYFKLKSWEMFIDCFHNGRLMIEGFGRWIASVDFIDETPEQVFEKLKELVLSGPRQSAG